MLPEWSWALRWKLRGQPLCHSYRHGQGPDDAAGAPTPLELEPQTCVAATGQSLWSVCPAYCTSCLSPSHSHPVRHRPATLRRTDAPMQGDASTAEQVQQAVAASMQLPPELAAAYHAASKRLTGACTPAQVGRPAAQPTAGSPSPDSSCAVHLPCRGHHKCLQQAAPGGQASLSCCSSSGAGRSLPCVQEHSIAEDILLHIEAASGRTQSQPSSALLAGAAMHVSHDACLTLAPRCEQA